jgi:meso-butanediol dehydrogenase / (S,S)-butanediol dehydrogenase / diacetyl reductase
MTERVALITGAASGIGAATTRRLAADGWQLGLAGRRPEPLHAIADELHALAIVGDAATEMGAASAVDETVDRYGRLDALVANAGVLLPGRAEQLTTEAWGETLRINLTGPFLQARRALDHLRRTRGAIVAVSSVGGLRAGPGAVAYSTSKAALNMLVQALAVDHGPEGVRVNAVAPGWVRTEMGDEEMLEFGSERGLTVEEGYRRVTEHVPARRAGDSEEIAAAVVWLLSSEAGYVNGAILSVDGGTAAVDVGTVALADDAVPLGNG